MSEPEIWNHIVAFVQHVGDGGSGRAEASTRRWLDAQRQPPEGLALPAALEHLGTILTACRGVA